jgi:alpha-amylase/alpha-mannosidase (GH57 family)
MSREIGLVSCVKTKQDEPAAPRDLYTSEYFRKMRTYAETHHDEWWILSAKHHLLDPDGPPIEPYEKTLTTATVEQRHEWAQIVYDQLTANDRLKSDTTLVIHAGKTYYEPLVPLFENNPVSIEIPTDGLQIGETLAWYNNHA